MVGGAAAVNSGKTLQNAVVAIVEDLGLESKEEVLVGRRIWGPQRRIDVVVRDPSSRTTLGIECKWQKAKGTAEEKIPATIEDIGAWPIRGLVVYDGPGFSPNMESYLISTGKAVRLDELRQWLQLYFVL